MPIAVVAGRRVRVQGSARSSVYITGLCVNDGLEERDVSIYVYGNLSCLFISKQADCDSGRSCRTDIQPCQDRAVHAIS